MKKKSAKSTKPACLKNVGRMYRICNVNAKHKESYMMLFDSHDREDADSRRPKAVAWDTLFQSYMSNDEDLNELHPNVYQSLIGCNVPVAVCEFSGLCCVYRGARKDQSKSGNHRPISAYVGGNSWLIYWNALLAEIGDRNLSHCAYPQLDEDIRRFSAEPYKQHKKKNRGSSASEEKQSTKL